jgi:GNAT superfamily N-acetyltransferase
MAVMIDGGTGPVAESHLMRRQPRRGLGPGGVVVYTLEDLGAPAGSDPKAFIEMRLTADAAVLASAGVPPVHRGQGHGRRLARQVMAALRSEGCQVVRADEPDDPRAERLLAELGFVPIEPGLLELAL